MIPENIFEGSIINGAWRINQNVRGVDKRIIALATELQLKIFRRDGELWANEMQLTFRTQMRHSEVEHILTENERIELAIKLLGKVKEARAEWGSKADRFRYICAELHRHRKEYDKFQKSPQHRREGWLHVRPFSLDDGSLSYWVYDKPGERWIADVDLWGEEKIEARGRSDFEAIDNLSKMNPF